jgi:hypothetical protein
VRRIKEMTNTMNNEQFLDKIISLMQTDNSFDAPGDSVSWAKNIFRTQVQEPKQSIVKRFLAVLQIDLSANKPVFGERSAPSAIRQMLFQADEAAIDLRVSNTPNGFSLKGQIIGEHYANATIKIGDFEAKANDMAEFKFDQIPSGEYNLTIQTLENEIVIEQLSF